MLNDDFFEVTWHEKHRDVYESLKLRKKQLHAILLSRLNN